MDQVKYLKLEKNLKNGTVRSHGYGHGGKIIEQKQELGAQ